MIIGIIGIGLIGSSLARAFRDRGAGEIYISDRSKPYLEQAERLNLGGRYFRDAQELASHCDIIFVCVPVESIVATVRDICPHLKQGTVVTDVGSVKSPVTNEVRAFLPSGISFVPGHPITADSEQSGPAAGRADLFEDKTYVLIGRPEKDDATAKVTALVEKTGARVAYLDADKHDLILAFTSHLPHICAFAAMASTEKASERARTNVLDYAGGSFRDLTRVAASGAEMWKDIFLSNRQYVIEAYRLMREEMDHLVGLIEKDSADEIEDYIGHARELRSRHYNDGGKA